jgi:hypothetical protein
MDLKKQILTIGAASTLALSSVMPIMAKESSGIEFPISCAKEKNRISIDDFVIEGVAPSLQNQKNNISANECVDNTSSTAGDRFILNANSKLNLEEGIHNLKVCAPIGNNISKSCVNPMFEINIRVDAENTSFVNKGDEKKYNDLFVDGFSSTYVFENNFVSPLPVHQDQGLVDLLVDGFSSTAGIKAALPGYNPNAQVTVYQSGKLKDVTGFDAENDWVPKFSKWGEQDMSEVILRATLAHDFLDDSKHHLAGELFARAYANKMGEGYNFQKDILMSKENFDYVLSDKSCFGEDTCLTVTPEQLVNVGHSLGYVVSMSDVLSKNASNDNYNLSNLASTIQNDPITSNYNDTYAAYAAPLSTAFSVRTGGTDNLAHDSYRGALSASLESCIYKTQDNNIDVPAITDAKGVVTQKAKSTIEQLIVRNSANDIIKCSYNNSASVLPTILGENQK